MKWTNKGNEFRNVIDVDQIKRMKHIYVYDYGKQGRIITELLKVLNVPVTYIDLKKCEDDILSTASLDAINKEESIVVVETGDWNWELGILRRNLLKLGWKYGKNLFDKIEFVDFWFPIIALYYEEKLVAPAYLACTIIIGEKCTLNCEKCNANIPYMKDGYAPSAEDIKRDADVFFSKFDYVYKLRLSGGEPLLNKDLAQVIAYICERYKTQLRLVEFTTNGTIMPNIELLQTLKKYDVQVCISDYSKEIPRLKENYERLKNMLNEYQIRFDFLEELEWMDFGFDGEEKCASPQLLYDHCFNPCRDFRNGELMCCSQACYASRRFGYPMQTINVSKADKAEILEYLYGYYEDEGYPEACKYCNGHRNLNKKAIPAGKQIQKDVGKS